MRLARSGLPGYEKPSLVADDGARRDVSILLSEIDEATLSGPWWRELALIDPESCPTVDPVARLAPCIARPNRVVLGGRSVGLQACAPVGATDDIVLPAGTRRFACRAGLAVLLGRPNRRAATQDVTSIAGYCLYLSIVAADEDDPGRAMLAASRDSFLSLGPYLVSPDHASLPAELPIELTIGARMTPGFVQPLEPARLAGTLSGLNAISPLKPTDVVLLEHQPHTDTILAPDDLVTVRASLMGAQARRCFVSRDEPAVHVASANPRPL